MTDISTIDSSRVDTTRHAPAASNPASGIVAEVTSVTNAPEPSSAVPYDEAMSSTGPLSITANALRPSGYFVAMTETPPPGYESYEVDQTNLKYFLEYDFCINQPRTFRGIELFADFRKAFPKRIRDSQGRLFETHWEDFPVHFYGQIFCDCIITNKARLAPGSSMESCAFICEKYNMVFEDVMFEKISTVWSKTKINGKPRLHNSDDWRFWGKCYSANPSNVNWTEGEFTNLIFNHNPGEKVENVNFSGSKYNNVAFFCLSESGEHTYDFNANLDNIDARTLIFNGVNINCSFINAKITNLKLFNKVDFSGSDFGTNYQQGNVKVDISMFNSPEKINAKLLNKDGVKTYYHKTLDSLSQKNPLVRKDLDEQLVEMCNTLSPLKEMVESNPALKDSIINALQNKCSEKSKIVQQFIAKYQVKK